MWQNEPDQNLSHIERIIKSKRPDLLPVVPTFYEKLNAMRRQAADNLQDEKLGFNEMDFEVLNTLIPPCDECVPEMEEMSILIHYILIIVEIMNEIGWPQHLR